MRPDIKKEFDNDNKSAATQAGLVLVFGSLAAVCITALPPGGLAITAAALNTFSATLYGLSSRKHFLSAKAAIRFTELDGQDTLNELEELEMTSSLDRIFGTGSALTKMIMKSRQSSDNNASSPALTAHIST